MALTVPEGDDQPAPAGLKPPIPARFQRLRQLQQAQAALKLASAVKPDDHAQALRLTEQTGAPTGATAAAVRADPAKAALLEQQRAATMRRFPALTKWMRDKDHAAIGQDDVPALGKVVEQQEAPRLMDLLPDGPLGAGSADTIARLYHLGMVKGDIPLDVGLPIVAAAKRRAAAARVGKSAEAHAFDAAVSEAGAGRGERIVGEFAADAERRIGQVGDLYREGIAGAARGVAGLLSFDDGLRDGPITADSAEPPDLSDVVRRLGGAVGVEDADAKLRRAAGQAVDVGLAAVSHPRGLLYQAGEAVPQIALSVPGMVAGALTRNPAVMASGLFAGTYLAEFGGSIDEQLAEMGVDQTDPEALRGAYTTPGFLEAAGSRANRGALASASLDFFFGLLAGRTVAGARAAGGVGGALVAGAKETGEQLVSEGLQESARQLAETGSIKLPDVLLEVMVAGPQSVATVAGGAAARGLSSSDGTVGKAQAATAQQQQAKAQAAQQVIKGVQTQQDANAAQQTIEARKATKVEARFKPAMDALVREATATGGVATSVAVEAWDAAVTAQGKSPATEAQRLTGSATAYPEAKATGVLVVPFERLTDPDHETLATAVLPDVRFRPDHPTPREFESYMADLPAQLEQAATAAEEAAKALPAEEDMAADEERAAELEAQLGVPEGATRLLHQGPRPAGEAAPEASSKPDSEQISPVPAQIEAAPDLRSLADRIEAAEPGAIGGFVDRLTGSQPVAEAVRGTLAPHEPSVAAPDEGTAQAVAGPPQLIEALAGSAQRDPKATAAALRELADIRDRQAKADGPTGTVRRRLEAALRAAGRPAKEAAALAAILSDFVRVLEARYGVPAAKLDGLLVRYVAGQDGEPGARGAYETLTRVASIFDGADASTALHEGAHWITDVVGTLAHEDGAHPALVELWGDLAEGAGADRDAGKLTEAQHEKVAKSFEVYLRDGTAPSARLRRAFAFFADALKRVYANVRAYLGTDSIDPELRDVFDRLLATDAEIEAATAEASLTPLFATDAEIRGAGVDPALATAYRAKVMDARDAAVGKLTRALLKELEADQRAKRAERLAELRADTASRLATLPATLALKALQAGPAKLSRAEVEAVFVDSPNVINRLEKLGLLAGGRGTEDEGAPLGAVAEAYGLGGAAELVDGLLLASIPDRLVEAVAAERLARESPELLQNRERLRAEARAAVITSQREEVVAAELRMLAGMLAPAQRDSSKKLGESGTREGKALKRAESAERSAAAEKAAGSMSVTVTLASAAEMRRRAQDYFATKAVRDIKPSVYWAAVTRQGINAKGHFRAGNTSEAIRAKRAQQMNLALYREALVLREQAMRHTRRLSGMHKGSVQEALGKAGPTHAAAMNKLLGAFSFRTGSLAAADRAAARQVSLAAYVQAQLAAARSDDGTVAPELPAWLVRKADEPALTDWRNLTVAQLADLRESADQLLHIARTKNKLLDAKAERDLAAVVEPAREQIKKRAAAERDHETDTWLDKRLAGLDAFGAVHSTIDSIARRMDGDVAGGPVREALIVAKNAAEDAEVRMGVAAAKEWRARNRIFTLKERLALSRPVVVPGLPRRLSRENAIMVAHYWGSPEGRDRLFNTFTRAQVETILSTLTDKEVEFVNRGHAADETRWPALKALAERLWGVAPPAVEALPHTITRADGTTATLTGGHTKLKYAGQRADEHSEAEIARQMRGAAYMSHRPRSGSLIGRVRHVEEKLRLDFGVLAEATVEDIHLLSHMEPLKTLDRTLARLYPDIVAHWGKPAADQFKHAYADMARGTIGATGVVQRSLAYLRTGTVVARIGFNVSSAAMNLTDIPAAWTRVGPWKMARGFARMYADQGSVARVCKFVDESSDRMANRGKSMQRELHEAAEQLRPSARSVMTRAAFAFMGATQYVVDRMVWIGSYDGHRDAGLSHEEAVSLANQDVNDTQGSGLIGDLPAVMREGGEFQKLFTTFMGFATRKLNLTAEAGTRLRSDWKNPAEAARFGINMLLLWWLPATIAFYAYGGPDDEDDNPLAGIATEAISQGMSGLILLRELSGAVKGYGQYRGSPGEGVFYEASQAVTQALQGEGDPAAVRSTLTIASIITHLPLVRGLESYRGLEAYQDGDATPAALLVGPPRSNR